MKWDEAYDLLRRGKRVARSGEKWADVFLFLVPAVELQVQDEPLLTLFGRGVKITYREHIDMRYADGSVGVWVPDPANGDLESDAEDWYEVTTETGTNKHNNTQV